MLLAFDIHALGSYSWTALVQKNVLNSRLSR